MKKLVTLFYVLFVVPPILTSAQQMEKVDSAKLPISNISASYWLDMDNQGEHELILQSGIGEDSTILTSFNWTNFRLDTLSATVFTFFPIQIEDIDNNNQLDVIGVSLDSMNNKYLTVLHQTEGEFEIAFRKQCSALQSFFIQDWDSNGLKDLLLLSSSSDSMKLSIIKNTATGFGSEAESLLNLPKHSQLDFLDINQNGRQDMLASSNSLISPFKPFVVLNFKDSIQVKESELPLAKYQNMGLGDYNHDGKTDVFTAYSSTEGNLQHAVYVNDSVNFELYNSVEFSEFRAEQSFLADFNADGLTDIFINDGQKSALIYQKEGMEYEMEMIGDNSMNSLNFYDRNRDGKLDLTTISNVDTASVQLSYWENQTEEENQSPGVPSFHIAFQTAKGLVLSWNDSEDDHTAPENITYDVFIGRNSYNTDFLAPNFDVSTSTRLKTSRGNNFYKNEVLLDSLSAGIYHYGIQPIDNSLASNLSSDLCPPECGGRYMACGTVEICETVQEELITTCHGNTVHLGDSAVMRYWYSDRQGLLGTTDILSFQVNNEDVVYAREVDFVGCTSYQSFIIQPIDEKDFALENVLICEAENVDLVFPKIADSIKWYSQNAGFISDQFSTSVFVKKSDQINYIVYFDGCLMQRDFTVTIKNAQVKISNNTTTISRGGSVQLAASGAKEYEWYPSEFLSLANSESPVASPEVTTQFIVKGITSLGCIAYDTVEVRVRQEAFIPELFTPNGDAKNDRLQIYGLLDVEEFEFVIYDREGAIVYKTENADAMRTIGWDGTNGVANAEPGLYFWQVRGKYKDGQRIELNARQKGKVLLSK